MADENPKPGPKLKISLGEYLEEVARFCENGYGNKFRSQFEDIRGTSELAMLAAPTAKELEELRRAVAIMTPAEKATAEKLSDEQIATIAQDACIDPGNFAIFINGYAIACKRVS
jgi:DNA-binding IclR family transcriptional regulator